MTSSIGPISTTVTSASSRYTSSATDKQSQQAELTEGSNSVDPRSSATLSPRSADAILTVSSEDSSADKVKSTNSPSRNSSSNGTKSDGGGEVNYHTAGYDLYNDGEVILPEQSITTPGAAPGNGDGPGSSVGGPAAPVGGGDGSAPPGDAAGSAPAPSNGSWTGDPNGRITYQEAQPSTYTTTFDENPRGARIGDENTGAVAIGDQSGTNSDGSIWSSGQIIFKTEKGTFFAKPSVPGDVVIARFINGALDVSSATPT